MDYRHAICGAAVLLPILWEACVMVLGLKKTCVKILGNHVCITGGSDGIGFALAMECVKRGAARVTLIARTAHKLKMAKEKLEREFVNCMRTTEAKDCPTKIDIFEADVSDPKQLHKVFKKVKDISGPIDLLFASAGICICDKLENISAEEMKIVLDTNLLGAIISAKEACPDMIRRRSGGICLIASQAAQIGLFGFTAYSSSKFGLVGFAQSLAMELYPFNVLVSVAYPADVDTAGYTYENLRKPEATKLIAETSGLWQPSQIAFMTVNALERGDTRITYGFSGRILDVATCGFNFTDSIMRGLLEVLFTGWARVLVLMLSVWWRRTVNSVILKTKTVADTGHPVCTYVASDKVQ